MAGIDTVNLTLAVILSVVMQYAAELVGVAVKAGATERKPVNRPLFSDPRMRRQRCFFRSFLAASASVIPSFQVPST